MVFCSTTVVLVRSITFNSIGVAAFDFPKPDLFPPLSAVVFGFDWCVAQLDDPTLDWGTTKYSPESISDGDVPEEEELTCGLPEMVGAMLVDPAPRTDILPLGRGAEPGNLFPPGDASFAGCEHSVCMLTSCLLTWS